MSDGTKIEWTDATVNAVNGCSVVSPGCKHCYAMWLAGTRLRNHPTRKGLTIDSKAGPVWNGVVRLNEKALVEPLRWTKPRTIFWNAHGDTFYGPEEWIDRSYAVMAVTSHHRHQVLTKRSSRMRQYLSDPATPGRIARVIIDMALLDPSLLNREHWPVQSIGDIDAPDDVAVAWPLPNVWLGVSVEDQQRADERIPDLLAAPAAVRFLSCEPLLGSVDLTSIKAPRYPDEPEDDLETDWRFDALATGDYYWFGGEDGQPGDCGDGPYRDARIDWVIAGGESGPDARPMHPDWVRALRDQCASGTLSGDDAPVPFFFKQWGEWQPRAWKADGGTHAMNCLRPSSFQKLGHHPDSIERTSADPEWQAFAKVGKRAAGRLLDGVKHDGVPS